MNSYLILSVMLSGSLLAQQATNPQTPPIETPAPAQAVTNAVPADTGVTNAPAPKKKSAAKRKTQKKSVAKKKESGAELKTVPLVPGPAVVEANHVNVRGQARLKSEVVARLAKEQRVIVIEEIVRNNSGPDEPSAWAKILLPSDVHVWINSGFINSTNKTVKPKKLNVRSGPGENFSVLGRLEHGDAVTQINAKGEWLEIEAPTNAFAFVAAQYLKQEPLALVTSPTEPPPATAPVTNETAIAAAPTETPATTTAAAPAANTNASPETAAAAALAAAMTPAAQEPLPKRIVEREGIVRGTFSIQAPTHFVLISPENGSRIDYLYTTSTNLDLRRYKGMRIVVAGEEGLEERWGNTPVLTIQKIQVVE
jgi:uncharacterized protein YgiM (DUF1202 family)